MLVSFNQRAHLTQFNMIGSGPGKANKWLETEVSAKIVFQSYQPSWL